MYDTTNMRIYVVSIGIHGFYLGGFKELYVLPLCGEIIQCD